MSDDVLDQAAERAREVLPWPIAAHIAQGLRQPEADGLNIAHALEIASAVLAMPDRAPAPAVDRYGQAVADALRRQGVVSPISDTMPIFNDDAEIVDWVLPEEVVAAISAAPADRPRAADMVRGTTPADDGNQRCHVTHAPGASYVCWTHHEFLSWSQPSNTGAGCWCTPPAADPSVRGTDTDQPRTGCCGECGGTGRDDTPETSGWCWDCRGTGHPHVETASCASGTDSAGGERQ